MAKSRPVRERVALTSPFGVRVTAPAESLQKYLRAGYRHADAKPAEQVASDGAPKGNASREAWAAYAESRGIVVGDDMTRNEIRALISGE